MYRHAALYARKSVLYWTKTCLLLSNLVERNYLSINIGLLDENGLASFKLFFCVSLEIVHTNLMRYFLLLMRCYERHDKVLRIAFLVKAPTLKF